MYNSVVNSGELIEFILKNDAFYSQDRLKGSSITQLVIIKTGIEVKMAIDSKNNGTYAEH